MISASLIFEKRILHRRFLTPKCFVDRYQHPNTPLFPKMARRFSAKEVYELSPIVMKGNDLIDRNEYPLGKYKLSQMNEAREVLEWIRRRKKPPPSVINMGIKLLQRLVFELSTSFHHPSANHSLYEVFEPQFYVALLDKWKDASIKKKPGIMKPALVLEKLHDMRYLQPRFNYHISAVLSYMEVLRSRVSPGTAPILLERFFKKELGVSIALGPRLVPDKRFYAFWMDVWIKSGKPQTSKMILRILEKVRCTGNLKEVYGILVQYWSEQRTANDKIAAETLLCIYQKVKSKQLKEAEDLLQNMIKMYGGEGNQINGEFSPSTDKATTDRDRSILLESSLVIFSAYSTVASDPKIDFQERRQAMNEAENLFNQLATAGFFSMKDIARLQGAMMDLYACGGRHEQADVVLGLTDCTTERVNAMIKSRADVDKPMDALSLLESILRDDSHCSLNLETFQNVLRAWSGTSTKNAVAQAFHTFRLLKEDKKCRALGICPSAGTYELMLECLANHGDPDFEQCGKDALELLVEASQRGIQLKRKTFHNAILACLKINVWADNTEKVIRKIERAKAVLTFMEVMGCPPASETFHVFLEYYATMPSKVWKARNGETILELMTQKSNEKGDVTLAPTAHSFSLVFRAWIHSGDTGALDCAWTLFQKMINELKIDPSREIFTRLILFYSKKKKANSMERAYILLEKAIMNPSIVLSKKIVGQVVRVFADKNRPDFAEQILLRLASDKKYTQAVLPLVIERVTFSWLRRHELDRATIFVARMQELADQQIIAKSPSIIAYKTLIRTWTESKNHKKDEQIRILQDKLGAILQRKRKTKSTTENPSHEVTQP